MKNILKYGLFLAMPLFMACSEDGVDYVPAEPVDANNPAVEFSASNPTSCEVDPATPVITLTLTRRDAASEGTYSLNIVENQENAFSVPSSVTFAAGATEATVDVTINASAPQGVALNLTVAVDEAAINPYTSGYKEFSVAATVIKWEDLGTCYWIGNIVNSLFGVDPQLMYTQGQMTVVGGETRIRIANPYAKVATAQDELGAFDGYPYSEPGDVIDGDKYIFVTVDAKGVAKVSPCMMGMDYGYGAMSFFHINPTLSTNADYGFGKLLAPLAEDGVGYVYFPANSIAFRMADYNGTSGARCGECILFLSKADCEAYFSE